MRRSIERALRSHVMMRHEEVREPIHAGLAYDVLAPIDADGKIIDDDRQVWLEAIASKARVGRGYEAAYERWVGSLESTRTLSWMVELDTRMLLGHGNASATDVGLTLHHTWGTPYLPGSALKGLLSSYIQANYGPFDLSRHPEDPGHAEADRAAFQGPVWDGNLIAHGPGGAHRVIFGAPDADSDDHWEFAGATRGSIGFLDAWMVPQSGSFLALDVLTVHNKEYYRSGGERAPNDYDSPNPVNFLSVNSGVRFLVALDGPHEWVEFIQPRLAEAMSEWGIGGKTSSGYGRFSEDWRAQVSAKDFAGAESDVLGAFEEWFVGHVDELSNNALAKELAASDWLDRLSSDEVSAIEREAAWDIVTNYISSNAKTKKFVLTRARDVLKG